MDQLNGIPASPGIAIAPLFLFATEDPQSVPLRRISTSEVAAEWERFRAAVDKTRL